jgi:diguanylate cyclase (GGDEF)-like protein
MIGNNEFVQFISLLATEENTFQVSQAAFSVIGKMYHLCKVSYYYRVGDTAFTHGGAESSGILYQAEDSESTEAEIVREFYTGEQGLLRLFVFNQKGAEPFCEEEIQDLNSILEVVYFHLGRWRLIQQAQKNAMTDFITGMPNADGYIRYVVGLFMRQELIKYNAYYFNLKGFGLINRKFGQKETDKIIQRYAKVLNDFIDGEEVVGRLGGDNFVALIRKERTQEFLDLIAEVKTFGMQAEEKIPLVIKAITGVYEIDDTLVDCEPIISKPAMALNVAKNITRQPVVFATGEMDGRIHRQKQMIEKFPEALEKEEFVVYYQPKVETDSYHMVGAEALVRWVSDGEVIAPGEFVPVIEQEGSVCKLDFYMLEQVCKDLRMWIGKGIQPVRISVNFSRKHLSNPDLAEDILAVIQKYEIPTKYIEIEVTETIDEEEQGLFSKFMGRMNDYNIATSIDDFGTGYSSLNVLRSFPVDVLKIDKTFINEEPISENDEIILTNIVKMAKELHMDVLTEGVEHWKQVEFLHRIECNVVQGYLFDRPMPQVEFEKKLQMKQYDITKLQN